MGANRSRRRSLAALAAITLASLSISASTPTDTIASCELERAGDVVAHGGGLNKCGCHFNRKTGGCHCHQSRGCGCECQPAGCK